jgi:molybdopterin/thiamine biosynthesis adenylyltransferase
VSSTKLKIFGAGSIGSVMAVQAAKVGFKDIEVYDYDIVEEDNIGSQEFSIKHIGMKKTEAIQLLLKENYDLDISVVDGKITEETEIIPEGNCIYFCAFDSLEARLMLWNKLKTFPIIWGEARIGRDNQRFYFVDLRDRNEKWIAEYEKLLDPHGPRSELSCGEKGTYPSNAEIVGKIVRQLVNIAEGIPITTMYIGRWGKANSIAREPIEIVSTECEGIQNDASSNQN